MQLSEVRYDDFWLCTGIDGRTDMGGLGCSAPGRRLRKGLQRNGVRGENRPGSPA